MGEVPDSDIRNESFVGGDSEIDELLPTTVSICTGHRYHLMHKDASDGALKTDKTCSQDQSC